MKFTSAVIIACLATAICLRAGETVPLIHAHAHNDYEHTHPLFDALDQGFCSVEADVWLVNGELLVAHDFFHVKKERTLQSLYLDPLRKQIQKNGGRLYQNGPESTLLIDVKSEAGPTYAALREVLKKYADIMTSFGPNGVTTNAIRAIISGNRSPEMIAADPIRFAEMDGRMSDLESSDPPRVIGWMSDNWTKTFKWRGKGEFPDAERKKLKDIVDRSHARGWRVRLWNTAESPIVWRELRNAGVDIINTDNLAGLKAFLLDPGH